MIVIVKPDGVRRGLIGKVVSAFEEKGMVLIQARVGLLTESEIRKLYAHHLDKDFFKPLLAYMMSDRVLIMDCWIEGGIKVGRRICQELRDKYASGTRNVVHVSDSEEATEREKELLFEES